MPQQGPCSDSASPQWVVVLTVVLASLWLNHRLASAEEGWSLEGQGILFYTDDVGLFSATRRLSRDGDPTQPAIDSKLTDKGPDMVFEPMANIWTSTLSRDERNGAHENIYQGELLLAYRLTDSIQGFGGIQHSNRKESFESSSVMNTNVGIGFNAQF